MSELILAFLRISNKKYMKYFYSDKYSYKYYGKYLQDSNNKNIIISRKYENNIIIIQILRTSVTFFCINKSVVLDLEK